MEMKTRGSRTISHRLVGRIRYLAVLAGVATLGLGTLPASATAPGSPYSGTGYDVSYPNCSATATGAFAIVGVGGGRPFTSNACASSEVSQAPSGTTASLYFNTGYAGAYARSINPTCATDVSGVSGIFNGKHHALSQQEQAWEIGCSEALYAQSVLNVTPTMWWADIETGNSWSKNVSLNQFAIDGLGYAMAEAGVPFGFYSSVSMWSTITGSPGWSPVGGASGMWVAGGTCSSSMGASSTWLSQSGVSGGVDQDTAC